MCKELKITLSMLLSFVVLRRLLFCDPICCGDSAAFSESADCFLSRLKHEEFGFAACTLLNLRSASFSCLLTMLNLFYNWSLSQDGFTRFLFLFLFKAMLLLFLPVFSRSAVGKNQLKKRAVSFVGLSAEIVNLKSVHRISCQPSPIPHWYPFRGGGGRRIPVWYQSISVSGPERFRSGEDDEMGRRIRDCRRTQRNQRISGVLLTRT
jgi:hypothetical protein